MWSIVSSSTAVVPMLSPVVPSAKAPVANAPAWLSFIPAATTTPRGQAELVGHRREQLADRPRPARRGAGSRSASTPDIATSSAS